MATLAALILWPRFNKKIPAPLVVLPIITFLAYMAELQGFSISTIYNRFSTDINGVVFKGIPSVLPTFNLPWQLSDSSGSPLGISFEMVRELIAPAFTIALLAAIESLLAAVVADGMAHTKHDPDSELIALGVSNLICPFFGGIPATGALARTATNIKFGARSPVSSLAHGIFTLLAVIFMARFISLLPMASLAALLMVVAYNMSELKRFRMILSIAPRSDSIVLLVCFGLTVIFDMVIGVSVGLVLAAMLFVKRMAEFTTGAVLTSSVAHPEYDNLTKDFVIYEIAGPLFFAASDRAVHLINYVSGDKKGVVFVMNQVPNMDVTGLVALESAIERLTSRSKLALLVGVQKQPEMILTKAKLLGPVGKAKAFKTIAEALAYAAKVL